MVIDTSVFRPLDAAERDSARDALKVPRDAFMVAMVGANKGDKPPRKGWGEAFAAFARFRKKHPDAVLYCHTVAASVSGIDLRPIAASLGIEKHIIMSSDYAQIAGLYLPPFVAGVMGCADVLLHPSYGEGFGLPIVEAQATGTPVIVGDNSAQTELCGAGWKADCQPYWVADDMAWWHAPQIKSLVQGLEWAYKHRADKRLRAQAREFAEQYDADRVAAAYWKPALEMLEQYCGAVPVRSPQRNHGTVPLPTVEEDGLTWILRGHHTGDGLVVGHEDQLAPVFDRLLPEGGVLADVGAHVGRWALRLSRKASRVIAVEANPATVAVLRANMELNDITNVDVRQVAAWDERTTLRLEDPNAQTSGGSTRVLPAEVDTDSLPGRSLRPGTAQAIPLDEVFAAEERLDVIKLDVEGADLHALRGMAGNAETAGPVVADRTPRHLRLLQAGRADGAARGARVHVGALRHLPAEWEPGPVSDSGAEGSDLMGVRRIMHMVAAAQYDDDGLTVLYGGGEVHEVGDLPDDIPIREVIMSDWEIALAPAAAQA